MTGWSADGNWFWDGTKWNDAVSSDGRWRFDGQTWQPFSGARSPMPPPPVPVGAAAPAPAALEEAPPSWLAPSEVERLRNEKAAREHAAAAAAANPSAPLPKELDWRYVGQTMERHSEQRQYADWQVGIPSIVIFLALWWFCGLASLIYIWMTGWRTSSKWIVFSISLIVDAVLVLVGIALALQRSASLNP